MGLTDFLHEGNVLAIVGSSVTASAFAHDIDFTLITPQPQTQRPSPSFKEAVRSLVLAKKTIRNNDAVDFFGDPGHLSPQPYAFSTLSATDDILSGFFLTGDFFPSVDPLERFYQEQLGPNYRSLLFLRFVDRVEKFPLYGLREGKRLQDVFLIVKATERVCDDMGDMRVVLDRALQIEPKVQTNAGYWSHIDEVTALFNRAIHVARRMSAHVPNYS